MVQFLKLKLKGDLSTFQFKSGTDSLDNFIFNDSKDYIREGYSQVYFLREKGKNVIIGFFAISCGYLDFRRSLKVKRIKFIPSILLGQLAIDMNYQEKGYGSDIIKKVMTICLKVGEKVGCRMVIVDAITDLRTLRFYKRLRFKYLIKDAGEKIERALLRKHKPTKSTVKMYFDLNYIRKF